MTVGFNAVTTSSTGAATGTGGIASAARHDCAQIARVFGNDPAKNGLTQLAPVSDNNTIGQRQAAIIAGLFGRQNGLTSHTCAAERLSHEASLGNYTVAKALIVQALDRVVIQAKAGAEETGQR